MVKPSHIVGRETRVYNTSDDNNDTSKQGLGNRPPRNFRTASRARATGIVLCVCSCRTLDLACQHGLLLLSVIISLMTRPFFCARVGGDLVMTNQI